MDPGGKGSNQAGDNSIILDMAANTLMDAAFVDGLEAQLARSEVVKSQTTRDSAHVKHQDRVELTLKENDLLAVFCLLDSADDVGQVA